IQHSPTSLKYVLHIYFNAFFFILQGVFEKKIVFFALLCRLYEKYRQKLVKLHKKFREKWDKKDKVRFLKRTFPALANSESGKK
ncbi:MAG: hypothetical protein K2J80_10925, partial [Oscillospiraceae bacterium]|nr:hypothetical protein [Oscillospiraceae bacterium]